MPNLPKSVTKLVADNPDKIARAYNEGREDGLWIDLKRGWRREQFDYVHSVHEWTARDLIKAFRHIVPCDCDDCSKPAWGTQQWAETYQDDLGESPDY